MTFITSIFCTVIGHKWDRTHGYHERPCDGAICTRCYNNIFIKGKGVLKVTEVDKS